jgi:hypothetical protein
MQMWPRVLGELSPSAARLLMNAIVSASVLVWGIWLTYRGIDNSSPDASLSLIVGATLIVASLMFFQFGLRFFLKYRK